MWGCGDGCGDGCGGMDVGGWDDVGMEWEFNKKSAEIVSALFCSIEFV